MTADGVALFVDRAVTRGDAAVAVGALEAATW